ncbi:LPXTG cell wall anchor domain-containing protein [uncultured Microbacterium sp.]|uniref:LPXTG cell wall anchor domain-containing protein n=1 Tax=uncultured Microbacterium sp. TaxID=191216 RepID=UPI002615CCF0|nr:LPXTG cell wall anchor domain-containing protein [uncultured Microbacterium sp.]
MYEQSLRVHSPRGGTRTLRTWIGAVLAMVLAVAGLIALPATAGAAVPGVRVTTGVTDGQIVDADGETPYTFTFQYPDNVASGAVAEIAIPEGVRIPNVPAGNESIDSIEIVDGVLQITFKSSGQLSQGILRFDYVVDEPETGSGPADLTWNVDGTPHTNNVILLAGDDEQRPDLGSAVTKGVASNSLQSYLLSSRGVISLKAGVEDARVDYIISIDSLEARQGIQIADIPDEFLVVDLGSIAATVTTWDANGLNKTDTPLAATPVASGGGFVFDDVDLPANSRVTITYQAKLDLDRTDDLVADLQAKADALPEAGGTFTLDLDNTARVTGSEDAVATLTLQERVVGGTGGPNLSGVFGKTSSLRPSSAQSYTKIEVDDAGNLVTPLDITYSLKYDLRPFAGYGGDEHALTDNFVMTDTLATQSIWLAEDADFLTTRSGAVITRAADGISDADFRGNEYVGTFTLDGQKLRINVGQDATATDVIDVKAQIISVAGIPAVSNPSEFTPAETLYDGPVNIGYFTYQPGAQVNSNRSTTTQALYVQKDLSNGLDDRAAFGKSVGSEETKIDPATGVGLVPFVFTTGQDRLDVTKSRLVDIIDHSVFDVTENTLDQIAASISGTFGAVTLAPEMFDVSLDAEGNLVIEPNANLVGAMGAEANPRAAMTLRLEIPTNPVEGKETLDFVNTANLYGTDEIVEFWTSQATGYATSYGAEMEVAKALYDAGSWTDEMRVELDEEGDLLEDEFIYRIQLRPHGGYNGVEIYAVEDVLPEGMEFLGFVSDGDLETGVIDEESTRAAQLEMGGNLRADWDAENGTLTIQQSPGTVLDTTTPLSVNFKVRLDDFEPGIGVVNTAAGSSATIIPGEDPEVPGEDPEVPGEDPEVPTEEPEDPTEDPEVPTEEPEIPTENPDVSDDGSAEEPEAVEAGDEDLATTGSDTPWLLIGGGLFALLMGIALMAVRRIRSN